MSQARHLLIAFVKQHRPGPPEIIDTIALTVSEAVGNAVRHAYRDGQIGPVEVDAHIEDDWLSSRFVTEAPVSRTRHRTLARG